MTDADDVITALQSSARSNGFDAMPALIRVATDLFVGRDAPHEAEIETFEKLILGLLETADVPTRAIVARKLALCPHTPGAVLARLLMDEDMEVAGEILALSPRVPSESLYQLAVDGDAATACAIARRSDLEPELVRLLAFNPAPAVAECLVANPAATFPPDVLDELLAHALRRPSLAPPLLARDDVDPADLAPLYCTADAERRRAIREALERRDAGGRRPARTPRLPDPGDTALLEAVAASGKPDLVASALAAAFGIETGRAAILVEEPSGEPLVLALHAAGLSREAIGRVLLLVTPKIALSVPRFFALVELTDSISRQAALRLTAALTSSPPTGRPRHAPYLDESPGIERSGRVETAAIRKPARSLARTAR